MGRIIAPTFTLLICIAAIAVRLTLYQISEWLFN